MWPPRVGLRRPLKKRSPQLRSVRKVLKHKAYAKPCALTPHLSTSRHHFAKKHIQIRKAKTKNKNIIKIVKRGKETQAKLRSKLGEYK